MNISRYVPYLGKGGSMIPSNIFKPLFLQCFRNLSHKKKSRCPRPREFLHHWISMISCYPPQNYEFDHISPTSYFPENNGGCPLTLHTFPGWDPEIYATWDPGPVNSYGDGSENPAKQLRYIKFCKYWDSFHIKWCNCQFSPSIHIIHSCFSYFSLAFFKG